MERLPLPLLCIPELREATMSSQRQGDVCPQPGGRCRKLSVPGSKGQRDGKGMETRGTKWSQDKGLKCHSKASNSVMTARTQAGCQYAARPFMHMSSVPVMFEAVCPEPRTAHGTEWVLNKYLLGL